MIKLRFFILLCVCAAVSTNTSSAAESSSLVSIANQNLCARESQEPSRSVYLYFDGFGIGRASLKWAQQMKQDPDSFVKNHWRQFHIRGYSLAKATLDLLRSGQLKSLSLEELKNCQGNYKCKYIFDQVEQSKDIITQKINTPSLKSQASCTWIKKSVPGVRTIQSPDKIFLENLAMAYLDLNKYLAQCEDLFLNSETIETDLVLKFNLNVDEGWKENGFRFWTDFKYYFSALWVRNWESTHLKSQEFLRSFSPEEFLTLMADGCYSLTTPSCESDFLNATQLKDTLKLGAFDQSVMMANEVVKNQSMTLSQRIKMEPPVSSISESKGSTRGELLSLMKMRHQAQYQLYRAHRDSKILLKDINWTRIERSINDHALISDSQEFLKSELLPLCAEYQKVHGERGSPYAKELSISSGQIDSLGSQKLFGESPELIFKFASQRLNFLVPICKRVENKIKNLMVAKTDLGRELDWSQMSASKEWFHQITNYSLPLPDKSHLNQVRRLQPSLNPFIILGSKESCQDEIDCARRLIEAQVDIYHVALHRNNFGRTGPNELMAQNHLGGDVACKLYDPWRQSQLRKKNLVSDIVSSVISGVTLLPVYLDIDYLPKAPTSLRQLYADGKIKFDPQFDEESTRSTLFIDLGQLAGAPCYINVSNSAQIKSPSRGLLFQGITFQGCLKNSKGEMVSNDLELVTNQSQGVSGCGVCTLNFEDVAMAAVQKNYSVFRFGIRFVASLVNYFADSENPVNQPKKYEIDPEILKETYLKYNSIPDPCVFELVNGSRCMNNPCLSKTMSEVERKWNIKVTDGTLWNSNIDSQYSTLEQYTDVWMKVPGCDREIRVPIQCQKGKLPTFLNLDSKPPKCAQRKS